MFYGPVLVTGAAGFAGSHLIDALLDRGATDPGVAPSPAHRRSLRIGLLSRFSGKTWICSIARPCAQVVGEFRPSVVFHLAGAAHVGQSWTAAASTLEVNVMGTENLLEADRGHGLGARILVPGSASVYRDAPESVDRGRGSCPASPYAVSKLAQEQLAVRAARHGQQVFVTRPFNHIGPRQAPSFATASFARQIAGSNAERRTR